MRRTELHFHLLPAVDDGPVDLQEALALARLAVADGTGTVVCTSHAYRLDPEDVLGHVERMRAQLVQADIPLDILPGSELSPGDVPALDRDRLELIAQGPSGARWVLVEAPLRPNRLHLLHEARRLVRERGFGLLLAHPERCEELMAPDGGLDTAVAEGALLQVNASSLLGVHGGEAQDHAFALVDAGMVTTLASDAHRPGRGPVLSAAATALRQHGVPADEVRRLTAVAAGTLLTDGIPVGTPSA